MTKKLLTQIKNEWLSNLWLVLELLVVSVVMWYVVDYLYTRAATYLEPRGFNIEHCYLIELGELTPKSPDYIAGHTSQQTHDDIAELLERLRRRPEIEAVSLSQNSYPYNGSNSGAEVSYDTLRSPGWTIRRLVTPDFPRSAIGARVARHPNNWLKCWSAGSLWLRITSTGNTTAG